MQEPPHHHRAQELELVPSVGGRVLHLWEERRGEGARDGDGHSQQGLSRVACRTWGGDA